MFTRAKDMKRQSLKRVGWERDWRPKIILDADANEPYFWHCAKLEFRLYKLVERPFIYSFTIVLGGWSRGRHLLRRCRDRCNPLK